MDDKLIDSLLSAAARAWDLGNAEQVRSLYGQTLLIDPACGVALLRLAWLAEDEGNDAEAASFFRRLVQAQPANARALLNLGMCLNRQGHLDEAIAMLRRTTEADPAYSPAFCNLGLLLEEAGDVPAAIETLRKAAETVPDSGFIAYQLASLGAAAPPAICPPEYLVQLFDGYAGRFDAHLFGTLGYRGPQLLAEIVAGQGRPKPWDVLDLGCGTGMTAIPFRNEARRIVGVDLSPRMLERARERIDAEGRPIYDALVNADIVEALRQRPGSMDLILAADVFIYIGDVRPAMAAAYESLRPGGLFAFTTESFDGTDDFRLSISRRYAHSTKSICELADELNFATAAHQEAFLRAGDYGAPVVGHVFLLQKSAEETRG